MDDRLKKFSIIVDQGTYTAAAKVLRTSQPALTAATKKLERELKSELWVHGSRPIELTRAGILAYEQGKRLRASEQNFLDAIARTSSQKQILKLGCIDSIAEVAVANHMFDLVDDCTLSLSVQNSSILLQQLKKGQLDIIIIAEQINLPGGYDSVAIGREAFSVVGSPERVAAAHQQTVLTEFLAYNQGSTTYAMLVKQLAQNGLTIHPTFQSTNPGILLTLALQGKGLAALPNSTVAGDLKSKTLIAVALKKPLSRPIIGVWQQHRRLPKSVQNFLNALQKKL